MSVQSRIKLCVVGVVGLVYPFIGMLNSYGAGITPEQAKGTQGVVAGIGVIVLAALGIQTQAK